jgi:pimeloyl-ACP methyl ester carboxylesterase
VPPQIVAVPGLGLSAATPARLFPHLPGWACSAVELPAYGRPAPPRAALDPASLAGLLLDRLPDGPVVLLGHSASAQVVAAAAAAAPARVAALVLVGPTTDPSAASWPGLVRRWLRTAGHERPGQVPQLVHDYTRTGPRSMARGMDAARRHRITGVLPAVGAPVLVVRGAHDAICPPAWAAAVAAAASDGCAESLRAGAHMLPLTHPDLLAARIAAFHRARVK